jgi:hypothetical protein
MFNCICYKKDKLNIFLKKQKKEEYKNIKVNMYTLGNYEPMSVYHGNKEYYTNENNLNDFINKYDLDLEIKNYYVLMSDEQDE